MPRMSIRIPSKEPWFRSRRCGDSPSRLQATPTSRTACSASSRIMRANLDSRCWAAMTASPNGSPPDGCLCCRDCPESGLRRLARPVTRAVTPRRVDLGCAARGEGAPCATAPQQVCAVTGGLGTRTLRQPELETAHPGRRSDAVPDGPSEDPAVVEGHREHHGRALPPPVSRAVRVPDADLIGTVPPYSHTLVPSTATRYLRPKIALLAARPLIRTLT